MSILKIPNSLKEVEINIEANFESSSILPMFGSHRSSARKDALTSIKREIRNLVGDGVQLLQNMNQFLCR